MSTKPEHDRVAFSPGEFAALFGKSQTWGYRQIYAAKVTAITEHGRILIPAKEVERILQSAGIYDGEPKPSKNKEKGRKLSVEQKSIWQRFIELRRQKHESSNKPASSAFASKAVSKTSRRDVLSRVSRSWKEATDRN